MQNSILVVSSYRYLPLYVCDLLPTLKSEAGINVLLSTCNFPALCLKTGGRKYHSHCRPSEGLESSSSESKTLQLPLSGWNRVKRKGPKRGENYELLHKDASLIKLNEDLLQSLTTGVPSSLSTAAKTGQREACQAWSTKEGKLIHRNGHLNNVEWQTLIKVNFMLQT